MKRGKRPRIGNRLFYTLLVVFVFAVSALCVALGAYAQDGYSLTVGQVSPQKIKAPRDVENKDATDRNRQDAEKAASDIRPILKKDQSVVDKVTKTVYNYFAQVGALRAAYQAEELAEAERLAWEAAQSQAEAERLAQEAALSAVRNLEQSPEESPDQDLNQTAEQPGPDGQPTDSPELPAEDQTPPPLASASPPPKPSGPTASERLAELQVPFTSEQCAVLLGSDDDSFDRISASVVNILLNLWEQGVQEVDYKVIYSAQDMITQTELNSSERAVAYEIIFKFLEPNYVEDAEATEAARRERSAQYETVTLRKGQTIVDEGDIIRQDAYNILDSLGLVSGGFANKILPISGAAGVVALFLLFLIIYINNFNKNLLKNKKEAGLLFTLYTMTILLVFAMTRMETPYQVLPVFLFSMLASMLLDERLGAVLSVAVSVVSMLIFKGGPEFFTFYVIGGFAAAMLARGADLRSKVFYVGVQASAVCFALMFLLSVFFQKTYSPQILAESGYAALNGLFTVIICIGSLPFWEALFGVATNIRFLDLANPANPLMRRMILEAPGTYHHSLIVANLAEAAAMDIGADTGLAQAGGYYHDIGKLKRPQFFAENIAGGNPHDFLPPLESAEIISSHVTHGVEMANQYRLPGVIKSIISQHHGTTVIRFFYYKEKMENPDAEVSDAAFRYRFEKPQFREAGIVMLADTVEAAVRSTINSVDDISKVEELIGRLIKDKTDDGQLVDSGFTLKDIDSVGKAFLRVFKGMYHERVKYPGMGGDAGKGEAGE